jgi:sugar O-acyltransferase (sialic acid O-acetyltransferase NeuD family)
VTGPLPVIVLGAGGNCRDIVDAMLDANRAAAAPLFEPLGYLDDDPAKLGTVLGGVPVLGPLAAWTDHPAASFVNGVNGVELTRRTGQILGDLGIPSERWTNVLHPSAVVSTMAQLGTDVVLLANVTVNSDVRIGDHVMVLPNSVVSHDVVIEDHCYLTPGVVLAGYVHLGEGAYIGAGASVRHRVTVGAGAVVGMGSVVLNDVAAGATVYGSPARAAVVE